MDTVFIGTLSILLGILIGIFTVKRALKQDYKSEGHNEGSFKTDLLYIKKRTDDVLLEQKDTNRNLSLLTERLVRVEESSKAAHRRVNAVEDELKKHLDDVRKNEVRK